ncbi:hypothetical protein [Nocardioides antri]|uniref:WD40 repeat domain-containing protein n=1 Tax=Nocardioides antri TaxID=2607659 RepID=A0A5B1LZP1_9ACTN|nr:hypothetical protein [Nocardioides antri]KAA1426415.1 hypothetical protein F0U47_13485 [Nocardioides antri]
MTEQLKTLMDREADRDFAVVDLDAITAAGDRTVRRRRVATGVAGVAALAVVVTGAALLGGDGDRRTDFVDTPFRTDVPMWTEGSTLHLPDGTVDLGVPVVTLVRTSAGIVFQGEDNGIYRYSGSDPVRIGTVSGGEDEMDLPGLVGDADGTLVGWVDDSGSKPAFVVYDVGTGAEERYDEHTDAAMKGGEIPDVAFFMAIDGHTAYWLDRRGTVATDLETGAVRVLGGPDAPTYVVDAESGLSLHWAEDEAGGDLGTDVVDSGGNVVLGWRDAGSLGTLSPDGGWGAGLERATVVDIGSGEQHPIETGYDGDAVGYDWLDGDTLMVVGEVDDDDEIVLLQCEVPTGGCSDVSTLQLTGSRVALPAPSLLGVVSFGGEESEFSESSEIAVESSASAEPDE